MKNIPNNFFTEYNPNPVIEINHLGEIKYINLTARALFPTLMAQGFNHPIFAGLMENITLFKATDSQMIIFSKEIIYFNTIYEQQVFSVPETNSLYIYLFDITQRKNAEEELKIINSELEKRVKERTKELELAKVNAEDLAKRAEEANRAKATFLAVMSHEMRTPLNGVLGMTGLLLDTNLTEEQREFADVVRISGEILLSVIGDILDFSKIESGRMDIEQVEFSLQVLIDEIIDLMSAQIGKKKLEIGAFIESNVPDHLIGDISHIRQILNNFLSNAIKFTENGEVGLKIKLANKNNQQVNILFEVSDTGIGMPDSVKEKIFQPFTQGDASTTRKYGGTGLGLVISKHLIEMMGGSFNVKSESGKGSTFTFILPLVEHPLPDSYPNLDKLHLLHNRHVLCVDDNEINREIIKHQTESWDMRCDVASNKQDALNLLHQSIDKKDPYSLLLIDYNMPDIDGVELVKLIRTHEHFSSIPAIILSSLGMTFNSNELKQLKIVLTIAKPVRASRLYEGLIRVINNHFDKNENIPQIPSNKPIQYYSGIRVLLAEDNSINQHVSLRMLSKLGFKADAVANGLEVLQSIQNISYDLILMDCQMPELDGYEATTQIRASEKHNNKHIPIIALTAHTLKEDYKKCVDAGMDDYISKPFSIQALDKILKKWLADKIIVSI